MASFRKKDNGTYVGTIYVGTDNGKRINEYCTAPTLKGCKAKAREIEDRLASGDISKMSDMQFASWLDKWLELNYSRLSPTTYSSYKMFANKHFKPYFRRLKIGRINDIHIKDYINIKLRTLSSTTVRKHMMFMRMVLTEAKHRHIFDDVTIPKNRKYVPVVPTDEQFETIVADCKMKKKELIVLIAGKCGLRLGEIFALKWDDIDFKNKEIRVDESFARDEAQQYGFKEPKSDNGYRSVPCPDIILHKLKDYKGDPYKSRRGFLKKNVVSIRIFDGRPDNFSNNFAKSMDKLGMGDIRFHDLRHYYASWLYKNGIPDHVAAELLGHDIAVLKGIYQHLGLDDKRRHKDRVRELQNAESGLPFGLRVDS